MRDPGVGNLVGESWVDHDAAEHGPVSIEIDPPQPASTGALHRSQTGFKRQSGLLDQERSSGVEEAQRAPSPGRNRIELAEHETARRLVQRN